jgi:4-aminobutyrate aminotransferase-like enzyme/Ser/Thr protein kinase RdoA (MazF antagonist)
MQNNYSSIQITTDHATNIAWKCYGLKGDIRPLPGELDFNFKIRNEKEAYILKVCRPDVNNDYIDFQNKMLLHLSKSQTNLIAPKVYPDLQGNYISQILDKKGDKRIVRLLSWTKGRLWSSVKPQREELLLSLGEQAGKITNALQGFQHPFAHRKMEWDISQAEWTFDHLNLFDEKQKDILSYFQDRFQSIKPQLLKLRSSVVHNDVNDNNIVVCDNLINPLVKSIIDYGDAVYTSTINDLAITIAYGVMNKPDALGAAMSIVKGYHSSFPLLEEELEILYSLVAMRLVISVTKSAINKKKEPDNQYLLVSEKPAWKVLKKWKLINENFACYSFRNVCGYSAHPIENKFKNWAKKQSISIQKLFPSLEIQSVVDVDMSVSSTWLGHESEFNDNELLEFKLHRLRKTKQNALVAGGYLETRPIYCTNAYKIESNNGPEYRSVHLGVDFWVAAQTPIHSLFDGKVFSIYNNDTDKDYGPTLILEHQFDEGYKFYSLYGHLSIASLNLCNKGDTIKKGELIAYVGNSEENGNWAPHLHFQLMLDILGNQHDFPGVATADQLDVWRSLCPDPNLLFEEHTLIPQNKKEIADIISFRKKHLGKSLSLSYEKPLQIVRGAGAFLIDINGKKYLDTVNNVAHVGHEHPRVVNTAKNQMAVLNTNTRYLHENINAFAEELLSTFPAKLSVVHFVNSGSEANELALRMAKAYTKQKDMIAVEVGYHGNTSGCIDISSYKFDGKGGKGAPEYTHIVPLPDAYRGIYQGKETGINYASHISEQIKNIHTKGRKVAAFICESIISCGGQIELPENYLRLAYEAVRKEGGVCISDEVQVGCGRVGKAFWGFQLHDVIPDIVTIGKPIGNGHPLAAVVCTQEIAEAFANGMEYFNTFGGNPVSCAIGLEVLKIIKEEELQQNALEIGKFLKSGLSTLQKEFPIIGDVRGQGLFLGFELCGTSKIPLTDKAAYLANRMKELGILMSTDGKDANVLKIKPPVVFSKENAEELLLRLEIVFKEDYMKA